MIGEFSECELVWPRVSMRGYLAFVVNKLLD